VILQRRPMISMMNPMKSLPGMVTMNSSVVSQKFKLTAALVDERLRQQKSGAVKGCRPPFERLSGI
jgi:hypothetical protein